MYFRSSTHRLVKNNLKPIVGSTVEDCCKGAYYSFYLRNVNKRVNIVAPATV